MIDHLDKVEKFGWPWHGEWSSSGLLLPNDDVKDLGDGSPSGGNDVVSEFSLSGKSSKTPSYGDVLVFKVPGIAPATTSVEEAAEGKTWLNYAILSGAEHSLYGKQLGRNRWLYLDSNDDVWLAELIDSVAYGFLGIKFTTFGIIGGTPVTHTYNMPFSSIRAMWGLLLDATSNGRSITVACYTKSPKGWAVFGDRCDISGTPGVDLSIIYVSKPSSDSYTCAFDPLSGFPGSYSNTHSSGVITDSVTFDWAMGDTVLDIECSNECNVSARTYNATTGFNSQTFDGTVTISVGSHTSELDYTGEIVWSLSGSTTTADVSMTIDGYEFTGTRTFNATAYTNLYSSGGNFYPSIGCIFPHVSATAFRQSSKVCEVLFSVSFASSRLGMTNFGAAGDGGVSLDDFPSGNYSFCLVTPEGITPTGEIVPTDGGSRYFSWNPVTFELLESASPVCFV